MLANNLLGNSQPESAPVTQAARRLIKALKNFVAFLFGNSFAAILDIEPGVFTILPATDGYRAAVGGVAQRVIKQIA